MKVFISSVRRSLEPERDALPGLILALAHEPRRFEDFSATGVPSREACLAGVRSADAYLLVLGERYGDPLPDTGLAPTEEEFEAARTKGIPILVFVKRGITPEPRQQEFIDRVSRYADGRFRHGFNDVADMLPAVAQALRDLASAPTALRWSDLSSPAEVPWRQPERGWMGGGRTELATYVVPVLSGQRLQSTVLGALPERLAKVARDARLFGHDRALDLAASDGDASAMTRHEPRLPDAGLRVGRDRSITIWEELPTDGLGAVLDEQDLAERISKALRLASDLALTGTERSAVGISLNLGTTTTIGSAADLGRRSRAQPIGFGSGPSMIRVDATEAVPTDALGTASIEIARELARRVINRARETR